MFLTAELVALIKNVDKVDLVSDNAKATSISVTQSSPTAVIPPLAWERASAGKLQSCPRRNPRTFSRWESTPNVNNLNTPVSSFNQNSTSKPHDLHVSSPLKKPVRRGSIDFEGPVQRPLVLLDDVIRPSFLGDTDKKMCFSSCGTSLRECTRITIRKPVRRASICNKKPNGVGSGSYIVPTHKNTGAAALLGEALRLMDAANADIMSS
jgi:hypothetical protein